MATAYLTTKATSRGAQPTSDGELQRQLATLNYRHILAGVPSMECLPLFGDEWVGEFVSSGT